MLKYQGSLFAVKDVEVSKKFYGELFDQEVAADFGINVMFSGGFSIQQDFTWLTGIPKDQIAERSNNAELYFETDELEAFVEAAKAYPGVEFIHEIKQYDWKQRVVRLYDPDGHIIEVADCMPQVVRNFLADGFTPEQVAQELQVDVGFVESCRK